MYSKATCNRWPGAGLGVVLGCLLLVAAYRCEAQGNLVPNHSFEETDSCLEVSTVYYPETGPISWFSGGWTPDYFQSCLPYGAFNGVPLNAWSFQAAQDGECYAGAITYDQTYGGREYFMTQLLSPLEVGHTYYASFFVNAAWGGTEQFPQMWLASSGIGILFTMDARQWELGDPIPMGMNYAHVFRSGILSDTVGWNLVSGSFVADSAYRYMMIGNQFDNSQTDTVSLGSSIQSPKAYTLIDNVCVSEDPTGCPMVSGIEVSTLDAAYMFPNPAINEVVVTGLPFGALTRVHDLVGRCLWLGVVTSGVLKLSVGEWARGAYVLSIAEKGLQKSFKFVLIE